MDASKFRQIGFKHHGVSGRRWCGAEEDTVLGDERQICENKFIDWTTSGF
jgi:hypothetical protein